MKYAFVLWNKDRYPEMYDHIEEIKFGKKIEIEWPFQEKAISVGDRVFVYSSAKDSHGFIAAGHATTGRYSENGENIIKIEFDAIPDFKNGKFLSLDRINKISQGLVSRSGSGHMIPDEIIYDLELAWADTIGVRNDLINILKVSPEIDPDSHDGSYELVREAVASFAVMEDKNEIDNKDLDLIYRFSVNTANKSAHINAINDTHLPEGEKTRLRGIVDQIWENVANHAYSNHNDGHVGMFGDALHTYNKESNDRDLGKKIIDALVYIKDHSDEECYDYINKNLNMRINGIRHGSFSTLVHCLKPNSFPIVNSNQGKGNVFGDLGINLINSDILSDYATNCRTIKDYKITHFEFQNYRVFDLVSRMIETRCIDFDLIYKLLVGHKGESYSKKNETQKDKDLKDLGQKAKNEFDKFAKYINEDLKLAKGSCSGWINQGQNVPDYIWVEFKDEDKVKYNDVFITKPTKNGTKQELKEIPFSVALSVNRDSNNDLYYSLRVEYRDSGTDSREKSEFNKNVLYNLEDNNNIYYEIYSQNNYRKVNKREDALRIYYDEKDSIEKIRSVYLLTPPYSSNRTEELISEAKEGLKLLLAPYRSIFNNKNLSTSTSLESSKEAIGVMKKMNKKITSLNTILYGPPGTGKTYNSKYYAVAICDHNGDYDQAVAKYPKYEDLLKQYEKLVEEKRIAFTTFHQSYGYEEFIEGIKPFMDNSKKCIL